MGREWAAVFVEGRHAHFLDHEAFGVVLDGCDVDEWPELFYENT